MLLFPFSSLFHRALDIDVKSYKAQEYDDCVHEAVPDLLLPHFLGGLVRHGCDRCCQWSRGDAIHRKLRTPQAVPKASVKDGLHARAALQS